MKWLAIVVAGFATFLSRISFIAFGNQLELPAIVERALRFVGPAAFAAISIPVVLGGDGVASFGEDLPRIIAGTLAMAVVWKRRNLPLSLFAGMGSLWLLLAVF